MFIPLKNKETSLRTQFVFIFLSRGLGSALQAILVIVFARLAGADGMGLVAISAGVMSMVLSIAEFGMSPLLSKSRAIGNEKIVNSIVRANFISSIIFSLVGGLALLWYLDARSLPLVVAGLAVSIGLEKNTDVFLNILIADKRKWAPAFSILIRRTANVAVFLLLIDSDLAPLGAYVYALIAGALAGQFHILFYRRSTNKQEGRVTLRELLREAVPYSISNIAAHSRTLDSVLVGAVASVSTAGLYSAAMKLTNPLSLVAGSLTSVVMPFASRGSKTDAVQLGRRMVFFACGSLVLVMPFVVFSQQIVTFLLGDEFVSASGVLVGGLLAVPFLSLAPPLGSILQSQGEQKYVATNGLVFAVITLGLVAVGAVAWGGTGAAVALAFSFACKCLSLWLRLTGTTSPRRVHRAYV